MLADDGIVANSIVPRGAGICPAQRDIPERGTDSRATGVGTLLDRVVGGWVRGIE